MEYDDKRVAEIALHYGQLRIAVMEVVTASSKKLPSDTKLDGESILLSYHDALIALKLFERMKPCEYLRGELGIQHLERQLLEASINKLEELLMPAKASD